MKTWQYHVEAAEAALSIGGASLAPAMTACAELARVHLDTARLILEIDLRFPYLEHERTDR